MRSHNLIESRTSTWATIRLDSGKILLPVSRIRSLSNSTTKSSDVASYSTQTDESSRWRQIQIISPHHHEVKYDKSRWISMSTFQELEQSTLRGPKMINLASNVHNNDWSSCFRGNRYKIPRFWPLWHREEAFPASVSHHTLAYQELRYRSCPLSCAKSFTRLHKQPGPCWRWTTWTYSST